MALGNGTEWIGTGGTAGLPEAKQLCGEVSIGTVWVLAQLRNSFVHKTYRQ